MKTDIKLLNQLNLSHESQVDLHSDIKEMTNLLDEISEQGKYYAKVSIHKNNVRLTLEINKNE